jgi:hypothetical protein
MNLFKSSLQRASVKMSLSNLRKARKMAIRSVGTTDQARVQAVRPQTEEESGPGSVKDWADAMKIRAPQKIVSFIRRKIRD